MHEIEEVEFDLWDEAERISQHFDDAPVIVIVGGDTRAGRSEGPCAARPSTTATGSEICQGPWSLAGRSRRSSTSGSDPFEWKMRETEQRRRTR